MKTFVAIDFHYGQATIWQKVDPIQNEDGSFSMNPILKEHPFFSIVKKAFKEIQEDGKIILMNSAGGYNTGYNKDNVLVEFQAEDFPEDYPEFTDEAFDRLIDYLKISEAEICG